MWEGLGADGWVVCVCIAEVVVWKSCLISVCLGKQSNLGSEAKFIINMYSKGVKSNRSARNLTEFCEHNSLCMNVGHSEHEHAQFFLMTYDTRYPLLKI